MRVKDLEVGQVAWFSTSQDELRKGGGRKVTVKAIGRYTQVREPCGLVIVPTTAPGPTRVILEFEAEDRRTLARFGNESSPAKYRNNEGGRYLMHEAEHKIARAAAADRKLEAEAHRMRGAELQREAEAQIRKELAALGIPTEHLEVSLSHRYYRGDKYVRGGFYAPRLQVADSLEKQVAKVPEVAAKLTEYAKWKASPTPGEDCVI